MARKLLVLFLFTFLLLNLISNDNNNVNAAETEVGAVEDLGSDDLDDKEYGALQKPIAEQASGANEGGEKETVKVSSAKLVDGEDKGLEEKENNEDAEKLKEERRNKRRQNRLNRRRRRMQLRNRRRQQNAETDFQELPLSEHAHEEKEEYRQKPTTENIVDIEPVTEAEIQVLRTEAPKDIKVTNSNSKNNKRSRPQRKGQKKRANEAKNRKRNGNSRKRGRAPRKQNARNPKARRNSQKFMLNGIKFPQNSRGKAANRNRQQRPRGRAAGRRSNFRRRH